MSNDWDWVKESTPYLFIEKTIAGSACEKAGINVGDVVVSSMVKNRSLLERQSKFVKSFRWRRIYFQN